MNIGTVIWYDTQRGYGFIQDELEDDQVFITETELKDFGIVEIKSGYTISYEVMRGNASNKVQKIVAMAATTSVH